MLRQILKHFGLWANLQGRVRFLREPHETAAPAPATTRSPDCSRPPRAAARPPGDPALCSRLTLRPSCRRDAPASPLRLKLAWRDAPIPASRPWCLSKTEGGQGRTIPLTRRACATLTLWLSRFSDAPADGFLFPRHIGRLRPPARAVLDDCPILQPARLRMEKRLDGRLPVREPSLSLALSPAYLRQPLGSENPSGAKQTIMSLAGHVSKSMLARYSHIRTGAKQAAIDAVEACASSGRPSA